MTLRFDIEEPKPVAQMTETELRAYATYVVARHEVMKNYMLSVYTQLIQLEHDVHATQRSSSGGVVYSESRRSSSGARTDAQWRKMMMESGEDE